MQQTQQVMHLLWSGVQPESPGIWHLAGVLNPLSCCSPMVCVVPTCLQRGVHTVAAHATAAAHAVISSHGSASAPCTTEKKRSHYVQLAGQNPQ
eukprot:1150171-Pelagomonas_calceolata.AAC.1